MEKLRIKIRPPIFGRPSGDLLRNVFVTVLLIVWVSPAWAQVPLSSKKKKFSLSRDTLVLDSLSLIPGTVLPTFYPALTDTSCYKIYYPSKSLILNRARLKKKNLPVPDSVVVSYRTFPYNFEKVYYHRNKAMVTRDLSIPNNSYDITFGDNTPTDIFQNDGLTKNGSISRGITFGNNQDVVVNSSLNLQLSGKLTQDIDLLMAATDNNIPFQADGTTAQLQEFDKVYIQLSDKSSKLIVGDFQLNRPNGYFMNFYKRSQGGYFSNTYKDTIEKTPVTFKTQFSGAVSRGKFARNVIQGVENNQGPYRLVGADNETYIIVLSGTERVFIDGKQLQRGQENDYIIDYNTSEISFTARQIITKDKRIIVEFQYAERNYGRSLYFIGEEMETKKLKMRFNFYSEQDNKNRPLQQTLTEDQKQLLYNIGDTLSKAIASGATQATFNTSEVFYHLQDTLVNGTLYQSIFVYSTNPDSAKYQVAFSYVGLGAGSYNQISSTANGKVYQWVVPINGVQQGSYAPVIQLVTPKKKQMMTLGADYEINRGHSISMEGAFTKNDINTFSPIDSDDDNGTGFRLSSRNEERMGKDTGNKVTKVLYNLSYEYVQKFFSPIERYRAIEFERDWNRPTGTSTINSDQHLVYAQAGIQKGNLYRVMYGFNTFLEGSYYTGLKHQLQGSYSKGGTSLSYNGSYLNTKNNPQNTSFYRHKILLSQKLGRKLVANYIDDFERNLFRTFTSDSLMARSYQFWEWEGNISSGDSTRNSFKLFYRERHDKQAYANNLRDSTYAQNVGLNVNFNSIRNHPVTFLLTYRELHVQNTINNTIQPDNSLLSRVEYSPRLIRGFITSTLFYETGYGLENKKEYYYLEVAAGQGVYTWKDYNNNGIKELNEFEVAQYSDQATYIRVYTPTNEYVKVLHDQFSFSFNLRPSVFLREESRRAMRFIGRFATQTAYRLDRKSNATKDFLSFNPLDSRAEDTSLTAMNYSFRQSLFFNQSGAVFGCDYTYQDNRTKQLNTNGYETRTNYTHEVRLRWNMTRAWGFTSTNNTGMKTYGSQFFDTRNYRIEFFGLEQKLSYQPSTSFRLSAIYKYSKKQNIIEGGFQRSSLNDYAIELKYNVLEKGSLTGRADFITITYNDEQNTSIAYEMLDALKPGYNYTWNLSYQRNLTSNIQISITYDGRKSPNSKTVNIGGAQVRAFF